MLVLDIKQEMRKTKPCKYTLQFVNHDGMNFKTPEGPLCQLYIALSLLLFINFEKLATHSPHRMVIVQIILIAQKKLLSEGSEWREKYFTSINTALCHGLLPTLQDKPPYILFPKLEEEDDKQVYHTTIKRPQIL